MKEDFINGTHVALHVTIADLRQSQSCEDLFQGSTTRHAFLHGWPVDVEYFHQYRSQITWEFTPRREIVIAVNSFLRQAATQILETSDIKQVTFVGVHVRRTDYKVSFFGDQMR